MYSLASKFEGSVLRALMKTRRALPYSCFLNNRSPSLIKDSMSAAEAPRAANKTSVPIQGRRITAAPPADRPYGTW